MTQPVPLPVVSCDDCGACCRTQGSPPFVYFHPSLYLSPPPPGWGDGDPDSAVWTDVPAEALKILQDYHATGDLTRYERGLPCLWYDGETKKCRFYAHRPQACREFEVGGEDCLGFRDRSRA